MNLYIFSTGDYDLEQWAVMATSEQEAKDILKPRLGESFDAYTKNMRVFKAGEIAEINNGD